MGSVVMDHIARLMASSCRQEPVNEDLFCVRLANTLIELVSAAPEANREIEFPLPPSLLQLLSHHHRPFFAFGP